MKEPERSAPVGLLPLAKNVQHSTSSIKQCSDCVIIVYIYISMQVAVLVPQCPSICTEEGLSSVCMKWRALGLSSALDNLLQYIDEDSAV